MGSEQRLETVVYHGTQVFEAIVANEAPYFAMGKGSHRLNPPLISSVPVDVWPRWTSLRHLKRLPDSADRRR